MQKASVDEKGRILLPASISEELGLKPDQRLEARTEGKTLVLLVDPDERRPLNIEEVSEGIVPHDPESAKTLWVAKSRPY